MLRKAAEGGFWLFASSIAINVSGVIFWFVVAGLAGVTAVGEASAIVSAAMMAVSLTASGLYVAGVREAAAGYSGAVVIVGGFLAAAAALLAYTLAQFLNLPTTYWAPAIAAATVLSQALLAVVVGRQLFKTYFLAALTASIAKILFAIIAIVLVMADAAVAALLGYLSFSILLCVVATLAVKPRPSLNGIARVVFLSLSNYPYTIATQLPVAVSIYTFAFTRGAGGETGSLYIAFMALLALSSLPAALLTASIPVAVSSGSDPFTEAARLGTAMVVPLAASVAAASDLALSLINPELSSGAMALTVLASTLPIHAYLYAAIARLNGLGEKHGLALIGAIRLSTLLLLLAILSRYGSFGAALAYTVSAIAALPLALGRLPRGSKHTLLLTASTLAPTLLSYTASWEPLLRAIVAATLSTVFVLAIGVIKPRELVGAALFIINTVKRRVQFSQE